MTDGNLESALVVRNHTGPLQISYIMRYRVPLADPGI